MLPYVILNEVKNQPASLSVRDHTFRRFTD